jgi:hypothetical protein
MMSGQSCRLIALVLAAIASGCSGSSGSDTGEVTCSAPEVACDGECADTSKDPDHCGDCDTRCDVACNAGACVTSCPEPTENCSGSCIDTSSDPAHCGGCDSPCESGLICEASECSCGLPVGFQADVQPIFTGSCALRGCHSGAAPQAHLDLSDGAAYGQLVGVDAYLCAGRTRVIAGSVATSYLYAKLLGASDICGSRMPLNGAALAADDLATIASWICNGALDD